jgi:hypothetical protein
MECENHRHLENKLAVIAALVERVLCAAGGLCGRFVE